MSVRVGAGACLMSTEQQLFFPFRKRTGEPKPASTQRHRSPSPVAYRQAELHSELFTKEPLQGLRLQRTKQTNGMMYRQHEVVFPLSEQSLTPHFVSPKSLADASIPMAGRLKQGQSLTVPAKERLCHPYR